MNRRMLQYVAGRIVYGVYAIGARGVQGGHSHATWCGSIANNRWSFRGVTESVPYMARAVPPVEDLASSGTLISHVIIMQDIAAHA